MVILTVTEVGAPGVGFGRIVLTLVLGAPHPFALQAVTSV